MVTDVHNMSTFMEVIPTFIELSQGVNKVCSLELSPESEAAFHGSFIHLYLHHVLLLKELSGLCSPLQ